MTSANKNPLRFFKGCDSKRVYESESVANHTLKSIKLNKKRPQRSYKCKNCAGWHTTTIRGKKV